MHAHKLMRASYYAHVLSVYMQVYIQYVYEWDSKLKRDDVRMCNFMY